MLRKFIVWWEKQNHSRLVWNNVANKVILKRCVQSVIGSQRRGTQTIWGRVQNMKIIWRKQLLKWFLK